MKMEVPLTLSYRLPWPWHLQQRRSATSSRLPAWRAGRARPFGAWRARPVRRSARARVFAAAGFLATGRILIINVEKPKWDYDSVESVFPKWKAVWGKVKHDEVLMISDSDLSPKIQLRNDMPWFCVSPLLQLGSLILLLTPIQHSRDEAGSAGNLSTSCCDVNIFLQEDQIHNWTDSKL